MVTTIKNIIKAMALEKAFKTLNLNEEIKMNDTDFYEKLQKASDKWNHYEQSNEFQCFDCYDVNLHTQKYVDEFRTTISYTINGINEKISATNKKKSLSISQAKLKFFEVNGVKVDKPGYYDEIGEEEKQYYSFINRLNNYSPLQKQYDISNISFSFTKIGEAEFLCCMVVKNLQHRVKFQMESKGRGKRDAQNKCVILFIDRIKEKAKCEMDEAEEAQVATLEALPLKIEQRQETALTTDVPTETTLPLIPMEKILQTSSVSTIINKNVNLTNRWIAIDKFRINRDTGDIDVPIGLWSFPEDILKKAGNSPNALLFKSYLLCQPRIIDLKFVINSNKFNQGRLVVSYLNDGKQMQVGDLTTALSCNKSYMTARHAIQRDHAFIDLNTSNEAYLKIPFLSTRNFVPIFDKADEESFSSALVSMHVISQLKVPDEAQSFVDGVLYASLPDIDFTALVESRDIVFAEPEGDFGYGEEEQLRTQYINEMVEREEKGEPTISFEQWKHEHFNPEFDKSDIDSDDEEPQSAESEIGPLATLAIGAILPSILKPIGSTLGGFGSNILNTILSPILGPVNRQRTIDKGEARFNTSQQIVNLDKPAKHKQPNDLRPNFVGDTSIAVFSEPKFSMRLDPTVLTPQTVLHQPNSSNTSIFELTRIWSYFDKFTWLTSNQTVGEELYSMDTFPLAFENTILGFFAKMYSKYSGTIEVRFDVVGTQFHTGSLELSYVPYSADFNAEKGRSSFYQLYYLREEKQFIFQIPFINTSQLRSNEQAYTPNLGKLKIFMRNALVPISTVTPSVEILVFVRAGPDFHFTQLRDPIDLVTETADAEMDTGDKDLQEDIPINTNLEYSGVVVNIGEDHEIISDVLKRYVNTSLKATNTTSVIFDLDNIFKPLSTTKKILDCYRFNRGGYSLLFTFKNVDSTPTTLANVDIENLDSIPNCSVNRSQNPTTITSIASPNNMYVREPDYFSLSNDFKIYDTTETWYTTDQNKVYYQTGEGFEAVGNKLLTPIESTLNYYATAGNNNSNKITEAMNNIIENTGVYNNQMDKIKTVMDNNVGINTFNNSVKLTTDQLDTCRIQATEISNSNITKQNLNNNRIVAAIDDNTSSLSGEKPTFIKVIYCPDDSSGIPYTGNPTQLINTSINPSCKIYVPFYSNFNYQDLKCTSTKKITASTKSLGKIVIMSDHPINIECQATVGDDFSITKFIGIPKYDASEILMRYYMDEQADCEMDKILNERIRKPALNFCSKVIDKGYASICNTQEANPFKDFKEFKNKTDVLTDKASDLMDKLTEITSNIVTSIKDKCSWLANTNLIFSSILHLLQAFVNPTKTTILIAIMGVITNLGILTFDSVTKIFNYIKTKLRNDTPTQRTSGVVNADAECDHDCTMCKNFVNCHNNCKNCSDQRPLFDTQTTSHLLGLILASICSSLGLKVMVKKEGLASGLFKVSTMFWNSLNGSIRFLESFITLISRCYNRILANNKSTQVAQLLSTSSRQVKEFVLEAQLMMNQQNRLAIQNDPTYKRRFWLCVTTAYHFQAKFMFDSSSVAKNILAYCQKLITLSDELSVNAVNCPVRYEPFVLGLKGATNIGKSYLINGLIPGLLKEVYNFSDYMPPIFTRTPGVEFWNNYTGQPCILYDDFLASTSPEIAARQVIELYNLKSSALMNCNMADLADKKIYANPLLVALIMNKHVAPNGTTDPAAFKRRKDSFWQVSLADPTKKRDSYTDEQKKNYEHLKFQFIEDPVHDERMAKPITFLEFRKFLADQMKKYHEKELQNVRFRFNELRKTLPENAVNMTEGIDPCAVFYNSLTQVSENSPVQTGMLPSEVLFNQLQLTNALQEQIRQERPGVNPEGLLDIIRKVPRYILDAVRNLPVKAQNALIRFAYGIPSNNVRAPLGQCDACFSNDVRLIYFCSNNHGFCSSCYSEMGHLYVREKCYCRMPYQFDMESYQFTLTELLVAVKNRTYAKAQRALQWFTSRGYHYTLLAVMLGVMVNILTSHLVANELEKQQKFYHDIFDLPYDGGVVKTFFGLGRRYDPNINRTEEDASYRGFIYPHQNGPGNHINRSYNYYEYFPDGTVEHGGWSGHRDYTVNNYDVMDKMQLMEKATVDDTAACKLRTMGLTNSDLQEYENYLGKDYTIESRYSDVFQNCPGLECPSAEPEIDKTKFRINDNIVVNCWKRKLSKCYGASTSKCSHAGIVGLDDSHKVDYEHIRNSENKFWVIDNIRYKDNLCCPDCVLPLARDNLLEIFALHNYSLIKESLRQLDNDRDIIEYISIPFDFICPDFFLQDQEEVNEILLGINERQDNSIAHYVIGKFKWFCQIIGAAFVLLKSLNYFVKGISFLKNFVFGENTGEESEIFEASSELNPSGDFKTFKLNRRVKSPRSIFAKSESDNGEHMQLAQEKIIRNSVIFTVKYSTIDDKIEKELTIRALGLFNRTIIMTKHEMSYILYHKKHCLENKLPFSITVRTFTNIGSRENFIGKLFDIDQRKIKFTQSDACFYELPAFMPQFKDITNIIANRSQHNSLHTTIQFVMIDKHTNIVHKTNAKLIGIIPQLCSNDSKEYQDIKSYDVYKSDYRGDGACGSIGIVNSNNPIFSLHIAGLKAKGVGYSLPLIKEDIMLMKENKAPYDYIDLELGDDEQNIQLEGDYYILGTVKKNEVPYQSSTTKIIPSLIHGKIEDTPVLTQPAILSNRDPRYNHEGSPLKWGCQKRCNPPIPLPDKLIKIALKEVKEEILQFAKPIRVTVGKLSIEDAIVGFPGLNHYDRLKLSTSCGYPFNLAKGSTTKESYIKIIENEQGEVDAVNIHKKLASKVFESNKLRESGIRPITIFQSTLKDERKSSNKLERKDGTRIFEQSPMDYTISGRMYTLDFVAAYMDNRHDLGHAVGICSDGPEWSIIAEKLLVNGNNIISGDFSDFGPRMWTSLIYCCKDIIVAWYEKYHNDFDEDKEKHLIAIQVILEEIATSYNICGNFVYQLYCGLPSGNPLTVILNTIVHRLLVRICWLGVMENTVYNDLNEFNKLVVDIEYGDDGIYSVNDKVKHLFNCETIGKFLSNFDFKYTDAKKEGNIPYTTLSEATFLKKSFIKHPIFNLWLAPLEKKSITEAPQWIFKSSDDKLATLENCKQSLNLAYGHGPEFFKKWKIKLNKALESIGLETLNTTWEELDENFFPDTYELNNMIQMKHYKVINGNLQDDDVPFFELEKQNKLHHTYGILEDEKSKFHFIQSRCSEMN
jgi:hypothetical protein